MDLDVYALYSESILIGQILGVILYIIAYPFKSIAIYKMSKKKGFKHLYLAWIPFLNFILLGKLVGKMLIFGKPINNVGVFVTIFAILEVVVGIFYFLPEYLDSLRIILEFITQGTVIIDMTFANFLRNNLVLAYLLEIGYTIISVAKIFFDVSLIFAIFRKYAPKNHVLFSILSIFFEFTFGFFLFAIRDKEPMTQEEYYKEMAQRRGYYVYHVNPNDMRNPYNPYNRQQPQQPTQEDPFPEFSDDNRGGDNSSSKDSKTDDLFD